MNISAEFGRSDHREALELIECRRSMRVSWAEFRRVVMLNMS